MFAGMIIVVLVMILICCGSVIMTNGDNDKTHDGDESFQYIELNGYTVTMTPSKDSVEDVVVCLMKDGKGFGMSYNPKLTMIAKSEVSLLQSTIEKE